MAAKVGHAVNAADILPLSRPGRRGGSATATGADHPCMYLPGKTSRVRTILAHRIPPALYHQFMDAGFRRSGS